MKIEILSNGNPKLGQALKEKLEKDFNETDVKVVQETTLKEAQSLFKEKFSTVHEELSRPFTDDNHEKLDESIDNILFERLLEAFTILKKADKTMAQHKEMFDHAIKIVYMLHERKWLDLFTLHHPEFQWHTEYFLKVAIKSHKTIFDIAPEYNCLF